MKWLRTFRSRLILTNVVLILIGTGAVATAMVIIAERQIMQAIDQDLIGRIERSRPTPPMEGRRGRPGEGNPDDPGGPSQAPRAPREEPPMDVEAARIADIRSPRFMNRDRRIFSPSGLQTVWFPEAFEGAWQGRRDLRTITREGKRFRIATGPLGPPNRIDFVVQVARELDDVEAMVASQRMAVLWLLPVILFSSVAAGWLMADRALRPVNKIAEASERLGAENLGERLPVEGDDELARMSLSINRMLDRLAASFAAQQAAYQKLETAYESQRKFAADASHELRTPLSRIKLVASAALSQNYSETELKEALATIDNTSDDMHVLVQDLLDLARADADRLELARESIDLSVWIPKFLEEFYENGATIMTRVSQGTIAVADPRALARILRNLIVNARRHTPANGTITLSAEPIDQGTVITVSDTGEGIPVEHLAHLTERFYRAASDRSRSTGGTGLGLSICRALVEAHGGTLAIESELGRGTSVTISLPS